jgi:signal transduction histidine kinase
VSGEVFENVLALYERKIESAGIQVEKQVDFDGEIIGLPGEMRQVFANLIGNAIEAIGKNGKIKLHAYASTDWRRGRRGLRVTVADNGPGIPTEVRGKILEPFFTAKGESGTGSTSAADLSAITIAAHEHHRRIHLELCLYVVGVLALRRDCCVSSS